MGRRTGAAGAIGIAAAAIGLLAGGRRHRSPRWSPSRWRGASSSRPTTKAEDERILAVDLASGEVVLAASDETRMRGTVRLLVRPRVRPCPARRRHRRGRSVRAPPTRLGRLRPPRTRRPRPHQRLVPPGPVGARPRVRERRRRDAARPGARVGRAGRRPRRPGGSSRCTDAGRSATEGLRAVDARAGGRVEHAAHLVPQRRRGARERGSPLRARRHGVGRSSWPPSGTRRTAGRERIVLMGWSMGGAIVLQAVLRSAAVARAARGRHPRLARRRLGGHPPLPGPGARPAAGNSATGSSRLLGGPWSGGLTGLAAPIDVEDLDPVARADEFDVPILLMHSVDDGFVPIDGSRRLAAARPDLIEFEVFEGARHTKLWNHDPERWTALIRGWLERERGRRAPPRRRGRDRGLSWRLRRRCVSRTWRFTRASMPVMPRTRSGDTASESPSDCG